MSHEIRYLTFDANEPVNRINAEIQHYVSCKTIEEGGHGLIEPINWRPDTIHHNYDRAYEFIQSVDRPYAQIAVKFREYPKTAPSAAMVALEERLNEEIQKKKDYISKHSVSAFKAEYIGCAECGSKLKKVLLKGEKCPLCGSDLRGKTTIETINRYSNKIDEIKKKILQEKQNQQSKLLKKSTVHWLVKIEYHV